MQWLQFDPAFAENSTSTPTVASPRALPVKPICFHQVDEVDSAPAYSESQKNRGISGVNDVRNFDLRVVARQPDVDAPVQPFFLCGFVNRWASLG